MATTGPPTRIILTPPKFYGDHPIKGRHSYSYPETYHQTFTKTIPPNCGIKTIQLDGQVQRVGGDAGSWSIAADISLDTASKNVGTRHVSGTGTLSLRYRVEFATPIDQQVTVTISVTASSSSDPHGASINVWAEPNVLYDTNPGYRVNTPNEPYINEGGYREPADTYQWNGFCKRGIMVVLTRATPGGALTIQTQKYYQLRKRVRITELGSWWFTRTAEQIQSYITAYATPTPGQEQWKKLVVWLTLTCLRERRANLPGIHPHWHNKTTDQSDCLVVLNAILVQKLCDQDTGLPDPGFLDEHTRDF